ncbi:nitrogen fixation negative regulator NifL [Rivihabitans pingtungensis]|uniref:nitrogen fixation negative regulator NifL n=1 Tax=Rivihabitans pingtungensis TaxID=1054498 RepID=UPI002351FBD3|nr:nitrogen fixation negative regulator NifL [Rivihabitans pingtungensis]MCK6437980.1 nitrogen fixation negative regulator NifL [Rivihabitans pingtungensis]
MSAASAFSPQVSLPPELYRQAVEEADLAISITDRHANILYANAAFTRVTGYQPEQVIGHNESMLSHRTTPREVYQELWTRLAAGQPWNGRLLNRRQDGSVYLAEVSITPVHAPDGSVSHYLGMHRDVTTLRQLECMVNNQKQLIASVLDAAPMVFALLDGNGGLMLSNQAYHSMARELSNDNPAHALMDTLCPDWRAQLASDPAHCTFTDQEARLDRPGGAPRWYTCSAQLIRLSNEAVDGFFCAQNAVGLLLTCTDITALRAEQERARTAALKAILADEERVASIRESLSAALFRLEEPMNVIFSAVNLLRRRDPASASMLEDALDASRVHLDALREVIPPRGPETMSNVNLNEILRDVLDIVTPSLLANGVVVDWLPAPTLPTMYGRSVQLRILFKALIDNAIEAMSGKGWARRELTLKTRQRDDCIVITVADRGPGMSPDCELRAFEPFFTTKRGGGRHLGTGLSRAYQVATDHGGYIDLGENPGGGCLVTVEFRLDGDPV